MNVPITLTPAQRRRKWLKPFILSYLAVFLSYMAMYLVRKNFNVSQNSLIETYGLTKTQLGIIAVGFSIAYGIGKFVLGYIADGRNTKQFLPVALICSCIAMLIFGLSLGASTFSIVMMTAMYALSGVFQSCGGPCSFATISKWTPLKRRATFLGLWNISHNLGGALAAGVAVFGANYLFHGQVIGMFIFPSLVGILIAIPFLFLGAESPEKYGLGKVEDIFEEPVVSEDKFLEDHQLTKFQVFKKFVALNPIVWLVCIASVFLYIIRIGIDQWALVYAREVLKFENSTAIQGFTFFEIGALIGTVLWGFLSDIIGGRRGLTVLICLAGIFIGLIFFQNATQPWQYLTIQFCLGFLVFGPQLLITMCALGFVPKVAVSVTDGLKGTFAYLIGDSFAKLGLGMIADGKSIFGLSKWAGVFTVFEISVICCIGLMLIVTVAEERKIRKLKAEAKAMKAAKA